MFFADTISGERTLSDQDPKSKKATGSHTFRKEPDGDLTPKYPERADLTHPGAGEEPKIMEPVFELEDPESSFDRSQQPVQHEIREIQLQVDDISRSEAPAELSTNQVDVLRKYIHLKETEVRDLKEQQVQYQTYVKKLNAQVQSMGAKLHEAVAELETFKRRGDSSKGEARELEKRHREEMIRLKNEYEEQLRHSGNVSSEYQELQRKREEWKDKVREDLKRIKLKERELENKYELLKRDTQALLDSKDKHVMELKRKNDALELEMEALEERLRTAHLSVSAVQSKKRRLIETLRLAISLLDQIDQDQMSAVDDDESKKAG